MDETDTQSGAQAPLPATQADRDAAAAYLRDHNHFLSQRCLAEKIARGLHDDHTLVQAFARHRGAATLPENNGYIEAFYEIGRMLDIGARSMPAAVVWQTEMRPKLEAALRR